MVPAVTLLHIHFLCHRVGVRTWSLFRRIRVGSILSQNRSPFLPFSLSLFLSTHLHSNLVVVHPGVFFESLFHLSHVADFG